MLSPTLEAALLALPPEAMTRFIEHLKGGTSADWLADWLSRFGTPVSATTIKANRSRLRQTGV